MTEQLKTVPTQPAQPMQAFHDAMGNVQKLLSQRQKPNSLLQVADYLDRELSRLHGLIGAKISVRESTYDDEKTLKEIREHYLDVLKQIAIREEDKQTS